MIERIQALNPGIAREACTMVQARLPTEKEYEYLSLLGDRNGGVSLDHMKRYQGEARDEGGMQMALLPLTGTA